MERRRFLALAGAAVAAGCLDRGADGDDEPPETSDFGRGWVPDGDYVTLGYADLGAMRGYTSLDIDEDDISLVDGATVGYDAVDEYIDAATDFGLGADVGVMSDGDAGDGTGASGAAFDALAGGFDASAVADSVEDAVEDANRETRDGFTVVRPSGDAPTVAVSDEYIVSGANATAVIDAATGAGEASDDETLAGLDDYTDEPLGYLIDFGFSNVVYRILEGDGETAWFTEVVELPTEEDAREVYDDYSFGAEVDDAVDVERDGTTVTITSSIGTDVEQTLSLFVG